MTSDHYPAKRACSVVCDSLGGIADSWNCAAVGKLLGNRRWKVATNRSPRLNDARPRSFWQRRYFHAYGLLSGAPGPVTVVAIQRELPRRDR